MVICPQCRHIFWRSMPTDEELAKHYAEVYTGSHNQEDIQTRNSRYYESHLQDLIRIAGVTPSQATIADYGSSYPILLVKAKEAGFSGTLGIEYDRAANDFGRSHGIEMVTPDEFRDQAPGAPLDIVRLSHVLEHLIDPLAVLKSISARMRKGGLLYITQPNFPVLSAHECAEELADSVWPEHLHFFSPISLCALATLAGFQITQLFSHQNAEVVYSKFAPHIDQHHASEKLASFSRLGDANGGERCNYPFYAGENSVLYGRNVAAEPEPMKKG